MQHIREYSLYLLLSNTRQYMNIYGPYGNRTTFMKNVNVYYLHPLTILTLDVKYTSKIKLERNLCSLSSNRILLTFEFTFLRGSLLSS